MKPKLNKLITMLLLFSTFAFISEAEEKVTAIAKKELSEWASWLPDSKQQDVELDSLNPYTKPANVVDLAHRLLKKDSGENRKKSGINLRLF